MRKLDEVLNKLVSRPDFAPATRLAAILQCWREVVGEDMAGLARPLGHRGKTLLIGCEDPVIMQELSYMAPDILEMVNAKFNEQVFDNVQFDLLANKVPLDEVKVDPPLFQPPSRFVPTSLGHLELLRGLDTPLGRAYAKYVRTHGKK